MKKNVSIVVLLGLASWLGLSAAAGAADYAREKK